MNSNMTNFNKTHKAKIKKLSQDDFNTIVDLRHYLLLHPDHEMVKTACLHYLGDQSINVISALEKYQDIVMSEIHETLQLPIVFIVNPLRNFDNFVTIQTENYDYHYNKGELVYGYPYIYVHIKRLPFI